MIREIHRALKRGDKYLVISNGGIGSDVLKATFSHDADKRASPDGVGCAPVTLSIRSKTQSEDELGEKEELMSGHLELPEELPAGEELPCHPPFQGGCDRGPSHLPSDQ
eukprot:symbB.v1.2.019996.t1/scaffold1657.1/size107422/5